MGVLDTKKLCAVSGTQFFLLKYQNALEIIFNELKAIDLTNEVIGVI